MLAETTPQFNLNEVFENGRNYWLYEAQFGPIPQPIAEMYNISEIDQMNAQLVNDEDYADFLVQSASGIPMF
jgi:hypothetical protein